MVQVLGYLFLTVCWPDRVASSYLLAEHLDAGHAATVRVGEEDVGQASLPVNVRHRAVRAFNNFTNIVLHVGRELLLAGKFGVAPQTNITSEHMVTGCHVAEDLWGERS